VTVLPLRRWRPGGSTVIDRVVHLAKHLHDVTYTITEIWCDATGWCRDGRASDDIDQCTCLTCLEEVRDFAKLAHKRWSALVRDTGRSFEPPP
jgi:hypothetical protein